MERRQITRELKLCLAEPHDFQNFNLGYMACRRLLEDTRTVLEYSSTGNLQISVNDLHNF